ncbi:LemA family protein [Ligilactobacillus ceti]|nr:LemA family protein [Ligilactobacillus ceti]
MIYIIIIVVLAVLIFGYISLYNGLQRAKIYTEEAWSQIDVQLKRRNDLIPNLVETTKGYAKHEKDTLSQVVSLRNQMTQIPSGNHQEKMAVSDQLSNSLKTVFALAESYPDLKANTEFTKLMEELSNTENKIAYSRQLFNSSAASYNQKLVTVPSNIVANIHHMKKVGYLETPTDEKVAPKVEF